jgi:hypothetical protein
VLSSVGKGSVCASIGKILQVRNHEVTAIKIDPYARAPDPAFYGFIKAILDQKLGQVNPSFDPHILDRAEARVLQAQHME